MRRVASWPDAWRTGAQSGSILILLLLPSTTTMAPLAKSSRCCARAVATHAPMVSGSMSLSLTRTTLGPAARVRAKSAPKSRSWVSTTWSLSAAQSMMVRSLARGSPTVDQCWSVTWKGMAPPATSSSGIACWRTPPAGTGQRESTRQFGERYLSFLQPPRGVRQALVDVPAPDNGRRPGSRLPTFRRHARGFRSRTAPWRERRSGSSWDRGRSASGPPPRVLPEYVPA